MNADREKGFTDDLLEMNDSEFFSHMHMRKQDFHDLTEILINSDGYDSFFQE